MPDQAPEETIIVAPFWPGEGYGGGAKVTSMEEALAEAKHLAEQGYGKGKSIIHIVRTTRTVIEWNSDHSDLAALPRPEAAEGAVPSPSEYRSLLDACWAINDRLRITPGMEAIFAGSTNDIDAFRDLLHELEPAYRSAALAAAQEGSNG